MRIVVAEDEFLIADMLVLSLEDAGHEVYSAPDAARRWIWSATIGPTWSSPIS